VAGWAVPGSDYAESTPATELSDEDLMSRIKNGDQAAFAILMSRHARVVLAVGRRVLHDQGAGRGVGSRLKKPVELVNFYPEGAHVLVRPQQKFLSRQSAVDWYCFWLKDEEDSDPVKTEQYKRWRELRKLQQAGKAEQKPN